MPDQTVSISFVTRILILSTSSIEFLYMDRKKHEESNINIIFVIKAKLGKKFTLRWNLG